jgi:regulator of protease activity HflC (stomatin/prohibitin superfamily)
VAEQQAQEAKFLLEKRQNEALAAIAEAEGLKQVRILQAQAEAEAIRIINTQLAGSPYYIKYIYAEKWNGILPATLVLANGQEFPLLGTLDLTEIGATPIAPPVFTPTATP